MKAIFFRTIATMFKPVTTYIYLILTILVSIIVGISSSYTMSNLSLEAQKINSYEVFVLLNFVWTIGILLVIFIVAFGSGVFAAEESEGTMRILVAKPVSRRSIIIGKILGLITGSIAYMLSSLIISISLYSLLVSLDQDVYTFLLSKIPSFIMYGVFIIFLFSGITSLLSSLFKKRIPAIVILILIILLTYGILPIARSIATSFDKYEKYKLYLLDVNYHLGSVYSHILEKDGELQISYNGQNTIGALTGIYIYGQQDNDIVNNNEYYWISFEQNDTINNNIVLLLYTLIGISSYVLCYVRMSKKDIN